MVEPAGKRKDSENEGQQRNVRPDRVIANLSARVAGLAEENAMQAALIADLSDENAALRAELLERQDGGSEGDQAVDEPV